MTEQTPATPPAVPSAWWWPSEGSYLIPRGGGVYDVLLPVGDGWETDCTPLHELPADAVELRPQPAAGAVPDTGHQAADVNEPAEALYTALHRLAYAWETDTTIKEMWAEWQRAKDAMAAYREVRASASGDTGQEAGDA